jgi:hypothetical protein
LDLVDDLVVVQLRSVVAKDFELNATLTKRNSKLARHRFALTQKFIGLSTRVISIEIRYLKLRNAIDACLKREHGRTSLR